MTLVVEDGTVVANANTYVTDNEFTAFAAARAVTLPSAAGDREKLLIKAMDVLESYDPQFVGERTVRDQPLSWPRINAVVNGWTYTTAEIPAQLKRVQLLMAIEVQQGVDHLNPAVQSGPVISKAVTGAVAVQYATPSGGGVRATKSYPSKRALQPLLAGYQYEVIR